MQSDSSANASLDTIVIGKKPPSQTRRYFDESESYSDDSSSASSSESEEDSSEAGNSSDEETSSQNEDVQTAKLESKQPDASVHHGPSAENEVDNQAHYMRKHVVKPSISSSINSSTSNCTDTKDHKKASSESLRRSSYFDSQEGLPDIYGYIMLKGEKTEEQKYLDKLRHAHEFEKIKEHRLQTQKINRDRLQRYILKVQMNAQHF